MLRDRVAQPVDSHLAAEHVNAVFKPDDSRTVAGAPSGRTCTCRSGDDGIGGADYRRVGRYPGGGGTEIPSRPWPFSGHGDDRTRYQAFARQALLAVLHAFAGLE
jgi:hypothetical protein